MIAHRLSTIVDADNIVVVSKGRVVQQGSHRSLLQSENSPYWKLIQAQELAAVPKSAPRLVKDDLWEEHASGRYSAIAEKESYETLVGSEATAAESIVANESLPELMTVFQSFGLLLTEQKRNWPCYLIMVLAAIGAAGE